MENIRYPEIASELNALRTKDQKERFKKTPNWKKIEEMDKTNIKRLKEIIAEIGWPNCSKVGEDASISAWLLVQHAVFDREFQEQCLNMMMAEPEEEVRKIEIAYLTDRILVAKELPQRYGTQFYKNNETGKNILRDVEDPVNLEVRRKQMGLEPFEDYLNSFAAMNNISPNEIGLGNFESYFAR